MNEAILTARGVRKAFMSGDRRLEVLAGVDLDVAAGESVSIRGESGSGKSTLLQLLAGLDAPDAGTLAWAAENFWASCFSRSISSRN
jgi:putative ABC transport system ATP-binding protein/lipoprotein-releasing system ATP-binding protein